MVRWIFEEPVVNARHAAGAQSVAPAYPAEEDQQPALARAFFQIVNASFAKLNASLQAQAS